MQSDNSSLVQPNSLRRVPGGTASLARLDPGKPMRQCVEVCKYGLLFAARQFALISWAGKLGQREQLCFSDLLHTLLELTAGAGRFYSARGYHGSLLIHASLHHV